MDDFGTYNGDTQHDMWVDHTYQVYTGEMNGGSSYGHYNSNIGHCQPRKTTSQLIADCKSRIGSTKANIKRIEIEIDRIKLSLDDPTVSPKEKRRMRKLIEEKYPYRYACYLEKIEKDEALLASLLIKLEEERKLGEKRTLVKLAIVIICILLLLFWLI